MKKKIVFLILCIVLLCCQSCSNEEVNEESSRSSNFIGLPAEIESVQPFSFLNTAKLPYGHGFTILLKDELVIKETGEKIKELHFTPNILIFGQATVFNAATFLPEKRFLLTELFVITKVDNRFHMVGGCNIEEK